MIIDYRDAVVGTLGGVEETDTFFKLYMVPGMSHCAMGPGANAFGQGVFAPSLHDNAAYDMTRALETWVEEGIAPNKIIATKYIDNKPEKGVEFSRPLCPYPQVRTYNGTGDKTAASNYECKAGPF